MVKVHFYKCFSINQHRFLKINGLKAVSKGVHPNGKTFWIYEVTDELSRLLTLWSNNKKK